MKNGLQKFILIYSIVCLCIILSGCSHKSSDTADSILDHPHDTLRIDVGSEVPTLDPQLAEDTSSTRVAYDLFAGLVDFNQKNQVIPGMAYAWDISPDKTIYTFHLRHNLHFSNGSPITAQDFVYSWRRLVDPKTASPYNFLLDTIVNAKQIIANKLSPDKLGVIATDQYTFIVHLEHPSVNFLDKLLLPNTFVVPQDVIQRYGTSWTNSSYIVTSGAYVLQEHVVNGYILAHKNLHYYDHHNVHIQYIKYLPFEHDNISIPSYRSGGMDVTFTQIPINQFDSLVKEYGRQVHNVPWEGMYYFDFNMQDPLLAKNKPLRQALSMAVNRQILANKVLGLGQKALYSTVTATINNGAYSNLYYSWSTLSYNDQQHMAQTLLAKAGYSIKKPLNIAISYNTDPLHKKVCLAVLAMWKDTFGDAINVTLQNSEWNVFLHNRHSGNFSIARDGWIADYNDVSTYVNLYYCGNGENNSHYCNSKYNKLIDMAEIEPDPLKQTKLFTQALELPLNDYAIIPLFQYSYQKMIKPYVKGLVLMYNNLDHEQSKWMSLN